MEQLIECLIPHIKKYGPLILGGVLGAIIHRLRTQMTLLQFIGSVIISMFVALSVGIICQDYFELKDTLIFVLCGASGVFSKAILDEIEEIIKSVSGIVKARYGKSEQIEIIPGTEVEKNSGKY